MKVHTWEEIQHFQISPIDLSWFVFHSKNISSLELKNLLVTWIKKFENIELEILKGKNGKPQFSKTNWKFNLSHSGNLTALAIHPKIEVGIDLESWKTKERLYPITQRYFFQEEKQELGKITNVLDWEAKALEMFTIKEALVKLRASTIFKGLHEINTTETQVEIRHKYVEKGQYSLALAQATL